MGVQVANKNIFSIGFFRNMAKSLISLSLISNYAFGFECFSLGSGNGKGTAVSGKGEGTKKRKGAKGIVTADAEQRPEGFENLGIENEPDLENPKTVLEKQMALNVLIKELRNGRSRPEIFGKIFPKEEFFASYYLVFDAKLLGEARPSRRFGRVIAIEKDEVGNFFLRVRLVRISGDEFPYHHSIPRKYSDGIFDDHSEASRDERIALSEVTSPIVVVPAFKNGQEIQAFERLLIPAQGDGIDSHFTFLWDQGRNDPDYSSHRKPDWRRLEGRFLRFVKSGELIFYGREAGSTFPLQEFRIDQRSIDPISVKKTEKRTGTENRFDDLIRSLRAHLSSMAGRFSYLAFSRKGANTPKVGWLNGLHLEVDGRLSIELAHEFPYERGVAYISEGLSLPTHTRIPIEEINPESLKYWPEQVLTDRGAEIKFVVKTEDGSEKPVNFQLTNEATRFLRNGLTSDRFVNTKLPRDLDKIWRNEGLTQVEIKMPPRSGAFVFQSYLLEIRRNNSTASVSVHLFRVSSNEDDSRGLETQLYSFYFQTFLLGQFPSPIGLWHKILQEIRLAEKSTRESPRPSSARGE